ncbi:MAG: SRPBCC family protein [Bacteroidota bacterium]
MKKIAYVLLALIAVVIILCLCGPSHVTVQRSAEINAPSEVIKSKITDPKFFQEVWSPWTEKDPGMKVTYAGTAGQEGASLSWVSDSAAVGVGSMTYKYTHGDTIMQSLYFEGQGEAQIYHVVVENDKGSKVTWIMENDIPFYLRFMMLFWDLDKMVGPDFEKGLNKLKTAIETMPATTATNYEINEEHWEPRTYIGKRAKINVENGDMSKMTAFLGENWVKLNQYLSENKLESGCTPSAIFFEWGEKETDMVAVMCVPNGTEGKDGYEKWSFPNATVLHLAYYGDEAGSMSAHNAISDYMKKNKQEQLCVVEEYVTDRAIEKDASKWLTNIYYVLKK